MTGNQAEAPPNESATKSVLDHSKGQEKPINITSKDANTEVVTEKELPKDLMQLDSEETPIVGTQDNHLEKNLRVVLQDLDRAKDTIKAFETALRSAQEDLARSKQVMENQARQIQESRGEIHKVRSLVDSNERRISSQDSEIRCLRQKLEMIEERAREFTSSTRTPTSLVHKAMTWIFGGQEEPATQAGKAKANQAEPSNAIKTSPSITSAADKQSSKMKLPPIMVAIPVVVVDGRFGDIGPIVEIACSYLSNTDNQAEDVVGFKFVLCKTLAETEKFRHAFDGLLVCGQSITNRIQSKEKSLMKRLGLDGAGGGKNLLVLFKCRTDPNGPSNLATVDKDIWSFNANGAPAVYELAYTKQPSLLKVSSDSKELCRTNKDAVGEIYEWAAMVLKNATAK
ncbi:hypothetical protein HDU93_004844 [Gonapodya sp. JEL0774]|nr:hypothetical protein HDU93_004844 [Gonapodya sp. JEL0774]